MKVTIFYDQSDNEEVQDSLDIDRMRYNLFLKQQSEQHTDKQLRYNGVI